MLCFTVDTIRSLKPLITASISSGCDVLQHSTGQSSVTWIDYDVLRNLQPCKKEHLRKLAALGLCLLASCLTYHAWNWIWMQLSGTVEYMATLLTMACFLHPVTTTCPPSGSVQSMHRWCKPDSFNRSIVHICRGVCTGIEGVLLKEIGKETLKHLSFSI